MKKSNKTFLLPDPNSEIKIEPNNQTITQVSYTNNYTQNVLNEDIPYVCEPIEDDNPNIDAIDGYFDGNVRVEGCLTAGLGYISNNLQIGGTLNVPNIIASNINTENLDSPSDLTISVPIDCTLNIPNIRYRIIILNASVINPVAIKGAKIFIVSTNILLVADHECDGIEITIYNRNPTGEIVIRDQTSIITKLHGLQAAKFIYLLIIQKWILV